jgi:AraC-like DNA-binding protein
MVALYQGGGDCFIVGGHFALTGNHAGILLGVLPPIVHIRKESDKAAMRWSLERMMQELREPEPGGFLVAQHLGYMMLVQALRLHLAEGLRGGVGWLFALADKQMSSAINSMHDDPAHGWTIQKLAERAGMSRSTFALKFKQTVGASPMEYLTRWRMLLSGDKLSNSSDPISVNALSLGYESESAFSTAFKRVMGCSPRQYSRSRNPASPSHSEGNTPAPIGSNSSQVDMRGWHDAGILRCACSGYSFGVCSRRKRLHRLEIWLPRQASNSNAEATPARPPTESGSPSEAGALLS